jgi:ubiquinol-cytochrome c reductase cytochrome b subunit
MAKEKKGWFEERLELNKSVGWFLNRSVPRGVGWWYVLGSATMVVFMILVVTGIFMMTNYSPSPDHAYDSIQYSTTQVPFGQLIRSIHFYAASAMIILVALHLVRVYFMAAYKYPRELTWVIGAILLLLVLGSSFTGYLLPWDQRAYWATNVASGISGSVPLIGPWMQKVLLGGAQIGATTLTRFFTFHVGVLPALIAGLIGLHLFMVIRQGISAPPGLMKGLSAKGKDRKEAYEERYAATKKGGEPFFPHTVARDTIFSVLLVAAIFGVALAFPHMSEAPADPTSTNYNPTPEWYFLFLFQFLKLFPGWAEPIAAVLIPGIAIVILICVPFIDRKIGRYWKERKASLAVGGVAVAILLALEVTGALSAPTRPQGADNPLVIAGQKVYTDINCGYCHSINGVGGAIGPDLSNVASQLTKDQMATYLKNPDLMVAGTLHPKLQFTADELNDLVAYLQTLGPPVVYSAQAPALFTDNCAKCHTINGVGGTTGPDLSQEGSHRDINFLQSFINDPRSVVAGTDMPAFHDVLSSDQIKDIASYLFSLKAPLTTPTPTVTPTGTPTPVNASAIYALDCVLCHGPNRLGGNGPPITASELSDLSPDQIANTIAFGTKGGMPGFSNLLTHEQIAALADFLKNGPP